jgi:hypothetical protein
MTGMVLELAKENEIPDMLIFSAAMRLECMPAALSPMQRPA